MYSIIYDPRVQKKDIPALSRPIQTEIKYAIEKKLLASPIAFSKQLSQDLKVYRSLRVGDYRIIFKADQNKVITIFAIGHRKNIYDVVKNRLS